MWVATWVVIMGYACHVSVGKGERPPSQELNGVRRRGLFTVQTPNFAWVVCIAAGRLVFARPTYGAHAPHDREICFTCETEFPAVLSRGTEVLAGLLAGSRLLGSSSPVGHRESGSKFWPKASRFLRAASSCGSIRNALR